MSVNGGSQSRRSSPAEIHGGPVRVSHAQAGVTLNITTISAFLKSSTKAPNFTLEVVQSSPTSLVLILDLPHRTDLVLNPDNPFLCFLELNLMSRLLSLCAVWSLLLLRYLRSTWRKRNSWRRYGEITWGQAAKEILGVWFERCAREEDDEKRAMGEEERMELERREKSFRLKNIEDDLDFQFPRLFGEEVSSRVLHVIKEAFRCSLDDHVT